MKTIYSLKEFRDEVFKIAGTVNEHFVSVRVELRGDGKIEFGNYIYGYSWEMGATMEESLKKQKDKVSPPPPTNVDVEIEMPEQPVTDNNECKNISGE